MDWNQAFGRAIRNQRLRLGISQETLAFRAEVHRTYISQLERGLKSPTLNSITHLSAALNIKVSDLIKLTEELVEQS